MSGSKKSNSWILAIRPKTLSAAVAPVLIGTAMAFAEHSFQVGAATACMFVALLLQIGSNLANDVYDFEKGADSDERLGPMRVTQAGLLQPKEIKAGMWLVFGLTGLIGLYLVAIGGWVILMTGLAAIAAAVAYTGGPFPLGYHGLGDLFVFVFFGLVATAGSYYLQVGNVSIAVWGMAVAMGCLTVNILVVNNIRDIESDRKVGKQTMAVRLGSTAATGQYTILLLIAYLIPLCLVILGEISTWGILTWFSLPVGIHWQRFITRNAGAALNKALAGSGQVELLYALLFCLGIILGGYL
jgi:1,4-dihydroxy-2-naphthoate octaprenyltransferase